MKRILLDENLPRGLVAQLQTHQISTVVDEGWSGYDNGELLRLAESRFDVFLTMDQGLRYQQNLTATDIAVVVVRAPTNRLEDLLPLTDGISEAVGRSESGDVRVVPAD